MKTISDEFQPYIGTKEYNGIVATIQKWFYGDVVHASWCATSVSYFMNELGLLKQIGGKNENVYRMMKATEKANRETGKGSFAYREKLIKGQLIPRGTIIFMLHSDPPMTESSSKHVTTAAADFTFSGSGTFTALGGNQSDSIRISTYGQSEIYAVFWPDYGQEPPTPTPGHETLRRGSKGAAVLELQADLNFFGYKDKYGDRLALDGSYGARTESAVKAFQKDNDLDQDGICGPLTWAKVDAMREGVWTVTPTTEVYCRVSPSKYSRKVCILYPGKEYTAIRTRDGWTYTNAGGWSKAEYLKTK